MKVSRSLLLGITIVIPQLGGAQLPFPIEVFAKFEGTLDFCAKTNPKDSEKYERLRKELMKGTDEEKVSEARKTREYKDAFAQAKSEFAKMPKEKAIAACSASSEDSK